MTTRAGSDQGRTIAKVGRIAHLQDPCSGATDTSRSSSEPVRAPSGLGRGLAGILGDALSAAPSVGVDRLVGAQRLRRSPEVRELVISTALQTLADGVGADGVVLVRRDVEGAVATVTSWLPTGWTSLSPVTFEVVGRLYVLLDGEGPDVVRSSVGSNHFLLCRHGGHDETMAAAVVRSTPFDDREGRVVGNLVRSIGAALGEPLALPADQSMRVLVQNAEDGVLADVRIASGDQRRHAASVAQSTAHAVAQAAAELCDSSLRVTFAGSVRVEGSIVTLAVVTDGDGGPLFGLAVDDPGVETGPAEAVFGAARVLGLDPFPVAAESR